MRRCKHGAHNGFPRRCYSVVTASIHRHPVPRNTTHRRFRARANSSRSLLLLSSRHSPPQTLPSRCAPNPVQILHRQTLPKTIYLPPQLHNLTPHIPRKHLHSYARAPLLTALHYRRHTRLLPIRTPRTPCREPVGRRLLLQALSHSFDRKRIRFLPTQRERCRT